MAGFVEDLVGFAAGEPLVPQVDGEAGEFAEFGGELLRFESPGARLAGEVQRVADDDAGDGEAAGETREGAQVVAAIAVDFEGENGPGGEAKFIGDGDANAFGANVEGEIAGCGGQ